MNKTSTIYFVKVILDWFQGAARNKMLLGTAVVLYPHPSSSSPWRQFLIRSHRLAIGIQCLSFLCRHCISISDLQNSGKSSSGPRRKIKILIKNWCNHTSRTWPFAEEDFECLPKHDWQNIQYLNTLYVICCKYFETLKSFAIDTHCRWKHIHL